MKYKSGDKVKIKSKEQLLKDIPGDTFNRMCFKKEEYVDKIFNDFVGKFVTIAYIDREDEYDKIPQHYHANEWGNFRFTDEWIDTNRTMRELLE